MLIRSSRIRCVSHRPPTTNSSPTPTSHSGSNSVESGGPNMSLTGSQSPNLNRRHGDQIIEGVTEDAEGQRARAYIPPTEQRAEHHCTGRPARG